MIIRFRSIKRIDPNSGDQYAMPRSCHGVPVSHCLPEEVIYTFMERFSKCEIATWGLILLQNVIDYKLVKLGGFGAVEWGYSIDIQQIRAFVLAVIWCHICVPTDWVSNKVHVFVIIHQNPEGHRNMSVRRICQYRRNIDVWTACVCKSRELSGEFEFWAGKSSCLESRPVDVKAFDTKEDKREDNLEKLLLWRRLLRMQLQIQTYRMDEVTSGRKDDTRNAAGVEEEEWKLRWYNHWKL